MFMLPDMVLKCFEAVRQDEVDLQFLMVFQHVGYPGYPVLIPSGKTNIAIENGHL